MAAAALWQSGHMREFLEDPVDDPRWWARSAETDRVAREQRAECERRLAAGETVRPRGAT
jgi:hypothetical protein